MTLRSGSRLGAARLCQALDLAVSITANGGSCVQALWTLVGHVSYAEVGTRVFCRANSESNSAYLSSRMWPIWGMGPAYTKFYQIPS